MKAIQIVAPGKLEFVEIPSRPLHPWEVRIAVASTCICGSDLKNISEPVKVPQVPGHEFSGVIMELSSEAEVLFATGDRVTAFPMMVCFSCENCRAGKLRDCAYKQSLGFQLPGSFAEEVIVDSRLAIRLADGLTYEQGALVEHLCCGYRLSKEIVGHQLPPSSHIAIIGDGPIALADVQALKLSDYRNITLFGKHQERMKLAKSLGAARVFDSSEVIDLLEGNRLPSIDACVMAAPAETTLQNILPLMRPKGLVFPQTGIKNQTLRDLICASRVALGRAFAYELSDFLDVMTLIKTGKLNTDLLVGERIELFDFVDAFPRVTREKILAKTAISNPRVNELIESHLKTTT